MTDNELNALVAERVMGYKSRSNEAGTVYTAPNSYEVLAARDLPDYCNDIAAAWEVAKKLRTIGDVSINAQRLTYATHQQYVVVIGGAVVTDNEAPRAICLAALKAVWVEVEC